MNIYHLPGTGIFGGIKVGFQFADMLVDLGAPCVVATPDGTASKWFKTSVPTVDHARARAMVTPETNILFSYPPDFDDLCEWGGRLVNHCQGTDDRMERIVRDPRVTILTCWPQARAYVREVAGRDTTDVGIPVSDCFYYDGSPKRRDRVAYMPRRGAETAEAAAKRNPSLEFLAIDGSDEWSVARTLKRCDVFLATSLNEQFGLPAFEAMAAGAIVISVPVRGGMDYLHHGVNCIVAEPDAVPDALHDLTRPENYVMRARLRYEAMHTALTFRIDTLRRKLAVLLEGELSYLRGAPPRP